MFSAISFTIAVTFLGQILNFLTDVFIAKYFGTSWKADAYILSLLLPVVIYDLFIGAINASFVPLYVSRQKTGDSQKFFNTVLNSTALVTLLIGIVVILIAPYFINLIATGFSPEARKLTVVLTRLLFFLVISMPVAVVLSNLLNAHNYFVVPAMGKAMNFGSIVLAIIVLKELVGIFSLVIGFFIGSLLFIAVQVYLARRIGITFTSGILITHPAFREMGILSLPLMIASMVNYANIFIERSVAASFSEGSIASLSYAFKVVNIPVNMLILSSVSVILPLLSRYADERDIGKFNELLLKGLKLISFVMVPVIFGMAMFRVPLIRLLFERGEFSSHSTEITASAVLFYVLGILGLSAVTLLTRGFYAMKDIKILSGISMTMVCVNIMLIIIMSRLFGFIGIPLTFTITYIIYMTTMMVFLEKRHKMHLVVPFIKSFAKHLFASGIMAVLLITFSIMIDYHSFNSFSEQLFYLILVAIIGSVSYIFVSVFLNVSEVNLVIDKLKAVRHKLSDR
ncbi:MAG: murein biosynthesis integral membrane protein MurJ [Nitrospirae bacterium]|nr:murein biosynthesis integral membrane protein MurJ [Nitrospirota bacterium]